MQIIHILGDIGGLLVKDAGLVIGVEESFFYDDFEGDVAVLPPLIIALLTISL